ncbi:SusC/RagA family TonB-linked outer membrane protein [Spirosoma pollinicola]|uniref:SusC/RagA family TonB-linked outer membrane protein n=1 Tax=Spirosoma pollinicola TaxID=2057025 RepID=A0A2K8ZCI7_9BACT|nr:SusC/RagA family TonB-linked outer membrane protein [Spirosoma pollinicola]AUD07587.1 SusC/RagA family TonB-linked outer membrane protein [Spirosoma pollinicola]
MAFLFCLLTSLSALAQTISGRITSGDDNQPLPGVSIVVKGTNAGTTSRADGTYSINVQSSSTLTFSFIGYATQEIAVANRTKLDVTMVAGDRTLTEVVVTALGIKKDIRQTGVSIQSVDGAQLLKAREPNAINSLVGKVSGLTIGASSELLRRPNIVLRGNTDVLFVVDGVPINSDTWNISADDIETYSVLKGASASALYGFRGKNGAILITTKRGTKDKRGFAVDVNTSQMVDNGFLAIPKVQDEYGPGDHGVYEFVDGKGGGKNDGDYDIWGPRFEGQLIPQYDSPVDPVTGKRTGTPWVARGKDNLKRFLQPGLLSTNNISVSSSGEKYDLRFSVSHNYQRGLVPNTKLNSTTFKVSTGYNFSNRLRFEGDVQVNRQYTPNIPDVDYGPNSMIYNIVIWGGADWDVDQLKNYWQPGKEGTQQIYAEYQRYNNPWFVAKEWLRGHYKTDIVGQTSLKYNIATGLDLSLRTQVSTWNLLRTEKFPYSATSYGREETKGDYREDRRNLLDNNTDLLLKYDKRVSPLLNINAIAGGNLRVYNYNSNYTSTNYLNVPGVYNFANSLNPVIASNFNSDMRVLSAYYSADFTLKDFLTVSTTGRMDKLSTLPKGNNTFFYPSVALSTVLSDYLRLPQAISFLKFRASYANVKDGLTQSTIGVPSFPVGYGQQYASSYDGPTYQNAAVYATPYTVGNTPTAYFTNALNNPNIKPNSTSQTEVGLDVRFLNNRLAFDAAYYISDDGPRIFNLPISETTGYSSALVNGIKTQKKGIELSLTGKVLRSTNGLNWDVLANWSTYKEVYKDFYPGVTALNTFFKVGDRTDKYYTSTFVRAPDGQIINDAGGRPIRTTVAQYVGNINPDWVFGLNNRFSYKNLTFSFQVDGRVGGVISDYIQQKSYAGGRIINTVQGDMGVARINDTKGIKSYLGEGVQVSNGASINYNSDGFVTNYAELQFQPNTTKAFLQDYIARRYGFDGGNMISRSFVKLREVVLGYSLPQTFISRLGVKQASVSFVARNLLYFAEKKDIDIDQFTSGGRSDLQTPTTRRYGFNLNLTF